MTLDSTHTTTPGNGAPQDLAPALAPVPPTPAELLAGQFAGTKAMLRPLYDAVHYVARRLCPQAKVVPAAGHIALLKRGVPFALVRLKKQRLELALALPDLTPRARWKKARGFGGVARMTHRVELLQVRDLDADVVGWMKRAVASAKPPPALKDRPSEPRR